MESLTFSLKKKREKKKRLATAWPPKLTGCLFRKEKVYVSWHASMPRWICLDVFILSESCYVQYRVKNQLEVCVVVCWPESHS